MRTYFLYVSLLISYFIRSLVFFLSVLAMPFSQPFVTLLAKSRLYPFATSKVPESWNEIGTDLESATSVRLAVHWILKTASPGNRRPGSPWDNLTARGKILSFRGHGSADCNGVIVLMPTLPPPYGWALYPREISCSAAEGMCVSSPLCHHM